MLSINGQLSINSYIPVELTLEDPELVRLSVEGFFCRYSIGAILAALANDDVALTNILANEQRIAPEDVIIDINQFPDPERAPGAYQKARNTYMTKAISTFLINAMPTPEAYARHLGFATFKNLIATIENAEHPEASRHYLASGCSVIADLYTRAGMMDKMNTQFVKFVMSAALGINEKTEVKTEVDNRVTISWGQDPTNHTNPSIPSYKNDPSLIELERLESALPQSMQVPQVTQAQLTHLKPMTLNDIL